MRQLLSHLHFNFRDYTPKSLICFREGYDRKTFFQDLFAGISVGIIALPLSLAFAIASGVTPEKGLFTAIVAGFLISLLGGSRVQIGGPTGAFVVIIYSIVQRHGYEGLAISTLIAGILMILMGVARLGVLLKFIPFSVTTGFTTGIALVILSSQVKDFFGLDMNVPPEFLEKCNAFCQFAHTWNPWAFGTAAATLALIFSFRYFFPKFPGVIVAISLATAAAYFFQLPVETIHSKFGAIARTLESPSFPSFSLERMKELFPDAISIALLGSIESLLSAVVADGTTGHRHRSNGELVAQGFANIGSIAFGGIPATGAIARTSANIRLGAKTPVAGMVHALTLLILMAFFAPLATKIPLSALSAVLVFVAWNMSELHYFVHLLKGPIGEAAILVITFLLTVLIDLTVAVQVGVLLSAFLFLKKMTDNTGVKICQILLKDNAHEHPSTKDGEILFREDIPSDVAIFEIKGPFFYSIASLLEESLLQLPKKPRIYILRMQHVPLVDATAIKALDHFAKTCEKNGIRFCISGAQEDVLRTFDQTGLKIGKDHFYQNINEAVANA